MSSGVVRVSGIGIVVANELGLDHNFKVSIRVMSVEQSFFFWAFRCRYKDTSGIQIP